jgi:hypothetical protein
MDPSREARQFHCVIRAAVTSPEFEACQPGDRFAHRRSRRLPGFDEAQPAPVQDFQWLLAEKYAFSPETISVRPSARLRLSADTTSGISLPCTGVLRE